MKTYICHKPPVWLYPAFIIGIASLRAGDSYAQVVQLPAIHTFSYSGTVSAPDAGIAYAGGVSNSNQGSTTRGWGPYAGRAAGSAIGGGHTSLSAMIIDLKAMDDAILGTTAPPKAVQGYNAAGPNLMSAQAYGYAKAIVPVPDPNGWQRALVSGSSSQPGTFNSQVEQDVRYFLEKAEESMRANRLAAARVYRRMAIERMSPEMRDRMEQRAKAIEAVSSRKPADSQATELAAPVAGNPKADTDKSALNKLQF